MDAVQPYTPCACVRSLFAAAAATNPAPPPLHHLLTPSGLPPLVYAGGVGIAPAGLAVGAGLPAPSPTPSSSTIGSGRAASNNSAGGRAGGIAASPSMGNLDTGRFTTSSSATDGSLSRHSVRVGGGMCAPIHDLLDARPPADAPAPFDIARGECRRICTWPREHRRQWGCRHRYGVGCAPRQGVHPPVDVGQYSWSGGCTCCNTKPPSGCSLATPIMKSCHAASSPLLSNRGCFVYRVRPACMIPAAA